jgi:uncharacterized protein
LSNIRKVFQGVVMGVWLLRLVGGLALCWCAAASWALENFYQVSVPVPNQAPEERAKAAAEGLRLMLTRFTGSRFTAQSPGLGSLWPKAETYLDRFAYKPGALPGEQSLVLQFSPQGLNRLVQDYQLPFWPTNRPKVLVWALGAEGGLGAEGELRQGLLKAADERGLSLVFAGDSEDRGALSASQLASGDWEAIFNASFRYSLDTVLVVTAQAGAWRWQWDHRGDKNTGSGAESAAGLHQLADVLAKRYAVAGVAGGSAQSLVMRVPIERFSDFKGLSDYLKKHGQVASAKLLQITPQQAQFELQLRGTVAQFDTSLPLDQRLEPAPGESAQAPEAPRAYRWLAGQ